MKPVVVEQEAQDEMEQAALRYEAKMPDLGKDFLAEVGKVFVEISRSPQAFGFFQNTIYRKRRTKRFPYLVIYREREDYVWVVAIAHSKRKSDYWLHRTEDD